MFVFAIKEKVSFINNINETRKIYEQLLFCQIFPVANSSGGIVPTENRSWYFVLRITDNEYRKDEGSVFHINLVPYIFRFFLTIGSTTL